MLFLVPLLIVAPMFWAQLGAIDDHWVWRLQQDPSRLFAPDFDGGRFRPAYWTAYFTEVMVWGQNAQGWFLDRLLLAVAAMVSGYALARLWLTPALSILAAALMLIGPQSEAFARLGPQEAFAVPLTLAGFALVGRRRFAGLALTTLAAFVKEPFVIPAVVAMGWAWWLGGRWYLVLPAAGVLGAVAGILAVVGQEGAYTPPGVAGRYLLPFVIPVAIVAASFATRRWVAVGLSVWLVVGLVVATSASIDRAAATLRFQDAMAMARGHPVVVTGTSREYIMAVETMVETWTPSGVCVEVAINAEPSGVCPVAVRLP